MAAACRTETGVGGGAMLNDRCQYDNLLVKVRVYVIMYLTLRPRSSNSLSIDVFQTDNV